ncbi:MULTISPECIES: Imm43 family immunity protein [unclassified Pseudomonas]|uniref:Imm43 family immunity protein n=1 Tax=unclassified Pseudomonas TaxID=196821 RepID=UPI00200DA13C|nr:MULTISPECIES: hypothetical protein [unclassified Pseudomonas]
MNFYVLSQKEEQGCPVGILRADLFDRYYSCTRDVEFGFFPWYAERGKPGPRTPFPEGMVLISKDENYEFDIRSVSKFFYVVSDEFLAACNSFNVNMVDSVRIDVVSEGGKCISSKHYNAVLFDELDVRTNCDPASTFVEEKGRPIRFKKLVLAEDWKFDLFKYRRQVSGSDSLICSQVFRDAAIDFKGIDFTPLETVVWSGIRRI